MSTNELFTEVNPPISTTRKRTSRSEFCNGLLHEFILCGKKAVKLDYTRTPFEYDELYVGLYNSSLKHGFINRVEVKKHNGEIILVRKGVVSYGR